MGFTVAEVLVTIAIIALLAAIVVPTILGRLESARADAIIGETESLQSGIMIFYRDVGRYPRRLDYLNTLPAGSLDACGVAIPAQNIARFRGPYISRTIAMINPPGNTRYLLATGDSLDAALTRTTITTFTGTQQVLQFWVYGPEQDVAEEIDMKVDGAIDPSAGTIQYVGNPQPNEYIVKWTLAIRTGAC